MHDPVDQSCKDLCALVRQERSSGDRKSRKDLCETSAVASRECVDVLKLCPDVPDRRMKAQPGCHRVSRDAASTCGSALS